MLIKRNAPETLPVSHTVVGEVYSYNKHLYIRTNMGGITESYWLDRPWFTELNTGNHVWFGTDVEVTPIKGAFVEGEDA